MSGSSGGGGSSGKVEYPEYMQNTHETWLGIVSSDINVGNPYTSKNAPSIGELTATKSANVDFKAYLDGRKSAIEGWLASGSATAPAIQSMINDLTAYINELRDIDDMTGAVELETVIYPRYEAGMRNINAVQSSAFVIGRAVMESNYAAAMIKEKYSLINEVMKMKSLLVSGLDAAKEQSRQQLAHLDGYYDSLYARIIDTGRLLVIAQNEQAAMDADLDDKAGRWKLDNWQAACNVMASISGGTAVQNRGTNRGTSALAGGLSGAAAGAQISGGNHWGALAGGVIGIGSSFL